MREYYSNIHTSFDSRDLITVSFERISSSSSAPVIEVTYEIIDLGQGRFSLNLLSSVRKDTREKIKLKREEEIESAHAASEKIEQEALYY